jgi:hypothetical protein
MDLGTRSKLTGHQLRSRPLARQQRLDHPAPSRCCELHPHLGSKPHKPTIPRRALAQVLLVYLRVNMQLKLTTYNAKTANTYGVNVQFTNLPQNYTLWWKARRGRTNAQGVQAGDFFVYGHPRGRFTSVVKFIVHLHGMINNIVPCPCERC